MTMNQKEDSNAVWLLRTVVSAIWKCQWHSAETAIGILYESGCKFESIPNPNYKDPKNRALAAGVVERLVSVRNAKTSQSHSTPDWVKEVPPLTEPVSFTLLEDEGLLNPELLKWNIRVWRNFLIL